MGGIAPSYGSKVETSVGRFFQFLKNRSLNIFQNQRTANSGSFEKQFKINKTLQEPKNFHERTGQEPMIFWPVL
jgi:hypothetical protein